MDDNMIVVVSDKEETERAYRFCVHISKSRFERVSVEVVASDPMYFRTRFGTLGWGLVRALLDVEGVREVSVFTHSIVVHVSHPHAWEKAGPLVLRTLKQQLIMPHAVVSEVPKQEDSLEHFHPDDSARQHAAYG